ncbi:unnamed protein product [Linum trigynum]|uniref:F-box domain-containing protein n=1 Tax=Linum trigynum TaxID=586398 RepID=A0AAV2D506_9ROSI
METPSLENPIRARVVQQQRRRRLPVLPPDLIVEILTWLPVDSLLRFRSVSKWFKTLISSPDFVKSHLRNTKALSAVKPNRVDRLFRRSLHSWSLDTLYNAPGIEGVELVDTVKRHLISYDWAVGSCDGMLCSVGWYSRMVVWNPSTGIVMELSLKDLPDVASTEEMFEISRVFGFGYDCQLDDYKVVAMISYPAENRTRHDEFETLVKVFALKTTSWRRVDNFKHGLPIGNGTFAAGRLYYKVRSFDAGNLERKDTLFSLDLATEKFNKVKLPDFDEAATTLWELGSFADDRLYLTCSYGNSCEVWVMKEPRVMESWTKLFRVDQHEVNAQSLAPLYISDNGEALWKNGADLFIYNSKDNTFRFPRSRGLSDPNNREVIYMETLVSPRMDN